MNRVETATVQQIADLSFFRRNGRWVDARIAAQKKAVEVDEVVAFGTPRFEEVLEVLTKTRRNGVLSLGGEALFRLNGKVVRVTFPKGK
jgi:hypothetical protein